MKFTLITNHHPLERGYAEEAREEPRDQTRQHEPAQPHEGGQRMHFAQLGTPKLAESDHRHAQSGFADERQEAGGDQRHPDEPVVGHRIRATMSVAAHAAIWVIHFTLPVQATPRTRLRSSESRSSGW